MPDLRSFMPSSWGIAVTAGWTVFLVIVGYAIFIPLVADVDLSSVDFSRAGLPPGEGGPFGTDAAGHDLFIRVAEGIRISLVISLVTAISSTLLGMSLGLTAGMLGGWVDRSIMRFVDALNALPHLLVGVLIVSLFRGSVTAIILSLVLTHWTSIARTVRAQVLGLRHAEFVQAAWLGGMSHWQIIRHHMAPAALGQAMVGLILLVPHTIWHESTLSFLGLGLPAHQASLGTLLADAQGALLLGQWWMLLFPSLLLILVTLAVAMIGADLKDRLLGAQGSLR
ncbi:ABC transporter permease [Rhizobium helianthi]|uniref:ABC transporter permease n=1 Tax=Rhizobium helianthi TaxID=1132695 RepID=A0ABW4M0U9_9HYPH